MRFENFSFGSIRIDGVTYEHDVVIDRGEVSEAKKEGLQTVSGRLRPYPALGQRRHPLAVPPASGRNRSRWQVAGDGRGATNVTASLVQERTNPLSRYSLVLLLLFHAVAARAGRVRCASSKVATSTTAA